MKLITLIFFLLIFAGPAISQDSITVAWDPPATGPTPDGYAVFDRNFQKPYDYASPICNVVEAVRSCALTAPRDRQTAYVARAWKYGVTMLDGTQDVLWSQNSNEAIHTPASEPPGPPGNLLARIMAAMLNFFEPSWDGFSDPAVIHLGEIAAAESKP